MVKRLLSSTSRKVMFLLYGASLALGLVLIVQADKGERHALEKQAMARLAGVTGSLSAQLDGGRITRLLETYDSRGMLIKNTQDAWYYVLHDALRKSAGAADLETPLTVLAYDPLKQELQCVVSGGDRPVLRDAYTGPASALLRSFLEKGEGPTPRGIIDGELVASDIVRDPMGRMVGLLLARSPASTLVETARGKLHRNLLAASAAFLLFGALIFRRVGRLVRHEEDARSNLQAKHAGITDSIAYAGKIQSSLIPSPEQYREQFHDFFVLNRPRDVVSGDFHWYHRISEHECLVAAADCTGHGLPGAMMAAIACSLLNDLCREEDTRDPALILAELNRRLMRAMHQEGRPTGAGDGMDIALCRIDRRSHELLFAGAFRPLYWMHDGHLTIINGDRMPIGGSHHGADRKYTVHRVAYHPGDSIYLFSDGYVDQFGGPQKRKFMSARLNELLIAHHHRPMALQAEALERAFLDWKGPNPQVDDVCMLGIAV
ncbi:MAG TPA: PP2C family protein-serine/threonine phosphatase [Flavobacteriales bacterium]|nr:PP2C family protein-serine/threonine phosphatase [Flavobacteriales bacterium]